MPFRPSAELASVAEAHLADVRAGVPGAWERLVEQYSALVLAVPRDLGLPPEECEEVFQDTWTALHRQVRSIRRPGSLVRWIAVTARRIALRRLKALPGVVAEAQPGAAAATPSALEHLEALERRQAVHEALRELEERCRELLGTLFLDGVRSHAEAGLRTGIKRDSVGHIRRRCLDELARVLRRRGVR